MGHAHQVVVEQLRRAASLPLSPRLLVASQLPHGVRLPHVQKRRRLCLHHNQRDAVDEEYEIGDDHALVVFYAAPLVAPADSELRGDDVLVEAALRMFEVEEAHRGGLTTARRVHGQGHAVGQVLVDPPVAGHARLADVLDIEDHAVGLVLRHPLVEPHEGCF